MADKNFDPVAIAINMYDKVKGSKIGELLKIKSHEEVERYENAKDKTSSVVARAAGSTIQFPIIATDDIPTPAADILRGLFEMEYAGYTMQAISANQNITASELNNNKFVQNIHRNIKVLDSVFDPNMLDCECVTEEAITGCMMNRVLFGESMTPGIMESLTEDSRRSLYTTEVPRGFEHLFKTFAEDGINIADNKDYDIDDGKIKVAKGKRHEGVTVGETYEKLKEDENAREERKRGDTIGKEKRDRKYGDGQKTYADNGMQKSYSYEKINQMQPYPIAVRVFTTTDNNDFTRPIDIVLGVKAVFHPIKRKNLVDALPRTLEDSSVIMKFIRWTSGELKFFKDLILGLDENKMDAIDISKRKGDVGANWLVTLKNAARKKKIFVSSQGRIQQNAEIIPNATLIVSQAAVDEMKAKYGWDLEDIKTVKSLADKTFLITFAIVDLGSNLIKVIHPETSASFDVMSLGTVQTKVDKAEDAALLRELRKVISNSK